MGFDVPNSGSCRLLMPLWYMYNIYTVEPRYNEVLGTMKFTLLYQVSHYIRVQKQGNIKSWDQQNYLVIRGFCYIRPLYNEVPLYVENRTTLHVIASLGKSAYLNVFSGVEHVIEVGLELHSYGCMYVGCFFLSDMISIKKWQTGKVCVMFGFFFTNTFSPPKKNVLCTKDSTCNKQMFRYCTYGRGCHFYHGIHTT